MATITLENVTKRFGPVTAVKQLSAEIRDGEFFCVLGPPGAGKTTTLRLIVGLEHPDEGNVYIDGECVNDVHPGQRDVAMMFQNLALYPDKTCFDNIAYPLRERKMPKDEITTRVTEVARKLYIDQLLARKPAKLSGGERQRVALARALVRRPRATLMDEPLANLDALLRLEMRVELKRIQQELKQTQVYVTHDQVEAMSMADRILVLHKGVLQQLDIPDMIYNLPANKFVATVIGSPPTNFIPASVQAQNGNVLIQHPAFSLVAEGGSHPLRAAIQTAGGLPETVSVGIRPEDIELYTEDPGEGGIPAKVSVIEPLGGETVLDAHVGPNIIKIVIPPTQRVSEGQAVWLKMIPDRIHLFSNVNSARLYTTGNAAPLKCLGAIPA